MRTRTLAATTAAAMLALTTTACGLEALIPGLSSPTPRATYDSVVELRDAAVAAGYSCPNWVQSNVVTNAAQSGSCSDSDVFSIYLTPEDAQATIDNMKSLGAEVHVLAGENWIINAPAVELPALKEALGGTIVQYAGRINRP